jgi:hypothetical protein
MTIPCVFIHLNDTRVLHKTIPQALKFNKNIVVIGDEPVSEYCKSVDVDFINYTDLYSDELNEFDSNYVHMSSNTPWIEKFCFLRWFMLNEYVKQNNLETIFYSDSDVMLYCNISNEWKKYEQFDASLIHRSCGSTSYFTKTGLDNFCKYTQETYRDKNSFRFTDLFFKYENHKKNNEPGGVCDMTLLDRFHYADTFGGGPARVGEMTHVIEDSAFDHNINVDDGVYDYDTDRGIKNIEFINGIPFCYHKNLKRNIKFNGLHFQGKAKQLLYVM